MMKMFLVLISCLTWANAFPNNRPWLNASLPVSQRVALLMKEMTLEEKAMQLEHFMGLSHSMDPNDPQIKAQIAKECFKL